MDSKIGFEMNLNVADGNTWTVCEFHGSNGNGFGDIWWTDNPIYFSSIDSDLTSLTGVELNYIGKRAFSEIC